jgi:O-antigen/teichoic acid export membrane protein
MIYQRLRKIFLSSGFDSVLRGAGALLLVRCASLSLGYLGTLLIIRWLGAEQAGIYIYCLSLLSTFAVVSSLGFPRAAMRFVAEYQARKQPSLLAGVIQTARRVAFVTGAVLGIGGLGAIEFGYVDQAWRTPLALTFISVPFSSLLLLNMDIALGLGWTTLAYVPDQLLRNIVIIAGIGACVAFQGAADAKDAAAIMLIAYVVTVGYLHLGMQKRANLRHMQHEKDTGLWFATSLPLWIVALSDVLLERIDVLLIGHFLPPENVAVFNAASRTAVLALIVQYAVIPPVSSLIAGLYARGRIDELRVLVRDVAFWTIWPSMILVLFLALAAPTVLRAFGPEFSRGAMTFYILLVAQMTGICMGPGYTLLTLTGHQTATMVTIASTTVISALLNWLLIPIAGIEGAAAATGFSIVFRSVVLAVLARRYLGIKTIVFIPWRRARL